MISKETIDGIVNDSLDQAENVWNQVAEELSVVEATEKEAAILNRAAVVPSKIPGYEFLEDGKPVVDEFIACVLDIRDSSKHLNCAIAGPKVQMLERVFYETAAILPASSQIVSDQRGGVTEYLGDGLLAFFRVDPDDRADACYRAHDAAIGCMDAVSKSVNPILRRRYNLPPLEIGIGLSVSKAVLTITGQANFLKPIAFGKCVFNATKISKGRGEVVVDEGLKIMWPTSENGKISFSPRSMNGVAGYVLNEE